MIELLLGLGILALAIIVIPGEMLRRYEPKSYREVELERFQNQNR